MPVAAAIPEFPPALQQRDRYRHRQSRSPSQRNRAAELAALLHQTTRPPAFDRRQSIGCTLRGRCETLARPTPAGRCSKPATARPRTTIESLARRSASERERVLAKQAQDATDCSWTSADKDLALAARGLLGPCTSRSTAADLRPVRNRPPTRAPAPAPPSAPHRPSFPC